MCKSITLALLWANWGVVTVLAIAYAVVGWMTFAFIRRLDFPNS